MPKQTSVTFNPYNTNSEEETSYQVGQVGSFKIAFRTMPNDLEFLQTKQKQSVLPPLEELKAESINIPLEKEQKIADFLHAEKKDLKEREKTPAPKEPLKVQTLAQLYKEAKRLYQQKLYKEAAEKFIEVLNTKPNHWRAKWYLGKTKKKIQQEKEAKSKSKAELMTEKENLAEKLKQEKEKQKQIIAKLKAEAQAKQDAEAKARLEAEARDKVGKELELIEQEKSSAIAQAQEIQAKKIAEEKKIKQEAEEKIRQEFVKKLESEEIQIKQEQEARLKLEKELLAAQQEKKKMEEEVEKERQELLSSQKAITEQLSAISKPVIPAYEKPAQTTPEPAPFWQETQQIKSVPQTYAPSPIIPITELTEKQPSFFSSLFSLLKIFFSNKTAKIVGLVLIIAIAGAGLIYFAGLYKFISSQQEAQAPTFIQETILPTSLFSVSRTETIELKAGQKKNLFQEISKLAEKNQSAGTFTRVLIKFTSEDQQQKYASLVDLIDALQIIFPAEILADLENSYTLFFYSQQELPDSPFLASLGENKLGLAITLKNKEKIGQQFINWEKTMPVDLDSLFLGKKISFSSNYQFQEITRNNITIHSLDLPNQYSSLNYAFIGNKIIITTSRESAEELIDRLESGK